VRWAGRVADKFHARFDAIERRYRYTILNRPTRAGYGHEYCAWIRQPLDAEQMQRAAQCLVGEHDFSAFRSAECQAPHAVRTINHIEVRRCADLVTIDVSGNAFLHNMVRIITGSLIKVGYGDKPPSWIGHVLESGDRTKAGMTAVARGLCFRGVCYPAECGLPDFAGSVRDSNGFCNLLL
jgi:tRNA pseudouridine38-40 synthase